MNFPSIDIQGSILSTEILGKIRSEQAKFQQGKDFNSGFTNAKLKDEISLAWQDAKGQWNIFKSKLGRLKENEPGTTETRNFWISPLLTNLGYNLTYSRNSEELNGKSFHIGYRDNALDNFPIYVGGYHESLDKRPENKQLRISPHAMLQEYLNYSEHLYGVVTNGRQLRLLRDASRITRLSYLEFNMEKIMEEDLYADFVILYRLLHASRMPRKMDGGVESIIENYHQEGLEAGSTIRSKLGEAVKGAIKKLANGFINHPNNATLRTAIALGNIDIDEYYRHQLRIVYRLLFLFVIEERNLVYADSKTPETKRFHQIYYNCYSLLRLRKLARKLSPDESSRHYDLWCGLISTFALFEKKEVGEKLGIMALQGDLFGYHAITTTHYDLHDCYLSNGVLLDIVKSLGYFENDNNVLIAVNYGGLDVEEFGSVYEGLLELKLKVESIPGTKNYKIEFDVSNERSKSGSHYTPEELVQPIIKHSLEHLIEDRVTPFQQKKSTRQATVQSLLNLKIADVTCGSGHILLSAARRLALEVARIESGEQQPNPVAIRKAMKDVIRKCIYGVDKNPLAVELCKIALWLEAYNPGEPLNFLDHHIKCGDAIVGLVRRDELKNGIANEAFKILPGDDKDIAKKFRDRNTKERKERDDNATQLQADFEQKSESSYQIALAEYKTFNQLSENTPAEIEHKAKAYKKFIDGKGFTFLKTMADTLVAQFFISKTNENKDSLMTDADFRLILSGYKGWQDRRTAKAMVVAMNKRFFHWFIEFPEVFDAGGFDCILGNPPYLGGSKISGAFGKYYLEYLCHNYYPGGGQSDFVIYFLRRTFSVVSSKGFISIITTNTISQSETRERGLDIIVESGGRIVFANPSIRWPGVANLFVTILSIYNGDWSGRYYLNNTEVKLLNANLSISSEIGQPYALEINSNLVFKGTDFGGDGFIIDKLTYEKFISENKKNKDVIATILNGREVNDNPNQEPTRFIINFYDWEEIDAAKYSEPYNHVLKFVKPEREKNNREIYKRKWWIYCERRVKLYLKLKEAKTCFVSATTTKYLSLSKANVGNIFSNALFVFIVDEFKIFSFIQSCLHNEWARKYGSTLKTDLRYTPTDCFETFPFPNNLTSQQQYQLETIGEAYHEHRRQLMLAIYLGLTKTYNLFHSNEINSGSINENSKQILALKKHLGKTVDTIPFNEAIKCILKLRELHIQMDVTVLDAYGWNDIQLRHDFYDVDYLPEDDRTRFTIHPGARKEVLKRLLELNHKIYAEEQALGKVKPTTSEKPKKLAKTKQSPAQSLFPMRPETAYAPIYSALDIARIINIKTSKIKQWADGLYSSGYIGISKDSNASDHPLLVNFYGVHEFIVMYDLIEKNKIPLKDVLSAREWLIQRFATGPNFYPFTSQKVLNTIAKAGKQIIFTDDKTGDRITLGKGNSQLNLEFIKDILKRIEFNKEMVSRLYLSDSHLIAIDPNLAGGRPCTVKNEILIDSIKSVYKDAKDIKYVAKVYEISEAAVQDALDYDRAMVLN